jgi:hypothetical protein
MPNGSRIPLQIENQIAFRGSPDLQKIGAESLESLPISDCRFPIWLWTPATQAEKQKNQSAIGN